MEFKATYEYLIAYGMINDEDETGIGRTFIILKQPIMSSKDIMEIEDIISENNDNNLILITHYQLIRIIKTKKIQRRKRKNDDTTND